MRKWIAMSILCLLSSPLAAAPAQAASAPAATAASALPVTVAQTLQWDMSSHGRNYRIFMYRPAGQAPKAGWPVVYVLDGNAMFLTTVETVQAVERRPDVAPGTSAVVVGIGYPDGTDVRTERGFDLVPVPARNPMSGQMVGGGADAFAGFINDELKPAVASRASVDPHRQALFGHSLAGMFVLHELAKRPDAFQTFLVASASIWMNDRLTLTELDKMATGRAADAAPLRVLMTVGEYERQLAPWAGAPNGDVAAANAQLKQLAQYENAQAAARTLQAMPHAGVELDLIPGEDHYSVVPAAIGRAIRYWLVPGPGPAKPG